MEQRKIKRVMIFSTIPHNALVSRRNADVMRGKTLILTAIAPVAFPMPASAQMMVDVPIWSNGILGQQALRSTYDNFDEANGLKKRKARSGSECSADLLPTADRRRMESEYIRRARDDGKASADGWVEEQGRRFYLKMVAQGICPRPDGKRQQVANNRPDPQ
ncbi:hypothetical protein [Sphingomonas sp. 3-13AW]|uniref:hypothetical protein n=1 Tax=Sphingomonas sp. 3-13AW TaxID=3050450 RepID=UPI003BB65E55